MRASLATGAGARGARGFTLVELMVYLALVVGGLVIVGGLAISAQRTVALQQALIDVDLEATRYLGALRRDVEASRSLELAEGRLSVVRLDGVLVVYGRSTRVEIGVDGAELGREGYRHLTEVTFTREGQGVVAEVVAQATFGWRDAVTKRFRRAALPRRGRAL